MSLCQNSTRGVAIFLFYWTHGLFGHGSGYISSLPVWLGTLTLQTCLLRRADALGYMDPWIIMARVGLRHSLVEPTGEVATRWGPQP